MSNFRRERREILKSREEISTKKIVICVLVIFLAGLSKVRTSPDHGTAFEIAGKGEARSDSFKEALFTARNIYFERRENKNLSD